MRERQCGGEQESRNLIFVKFPYLLKSFAYLWLTSHTDKRIIYIHTDWQQIRGSSFNTHSYKKNRCYFYLLRLRYTWGIKGNGKTEEYLPCFIHLSAF